MARQNGSLLRRKVSIHNPLRQRVMESGCSLFWGCVVSIHNPLRQRVMERWYVSAGMGDVSIHNPLRQRVMVEQQQKHLMQVSFQFTTRFVSG